ncbi:MAG: aminotransferase class V-fold PLP-dependent enzyme [Candidatus Pacebacteria bacterium]|nr:aminotransferase class V-fold PLP-dependent enzyme [Candidatus Paceibacterota bacterium]
MKNVLPKVLGVNNCVELKNGKEARVILLNNAATTPPFEVTLETVNKFLQTYGALHRGAGPNASVTFQKVQAAVNTLHKFLGMPEDHAMLFTSNASAAINLFIRLLRLKKNDVIITSIIEHTSNNLPWKYNTEARTVYINAFDDGSLDYEDLEKKVAENATHLKLIAITGASNLTGYIPDIERISKLAHSYNALLFIDAAQLAPHRPIDMGKQGIDALAFSAHKVYAPFGLGVLALSKDILKTDPVDPGGGSIDMISETDIVWAPPIARHQTGTWNVTGIIAAAASCKIIMETGWDTIVAHEKELVRYMAQELQTVPNIILYVPPEKYLTEDRIGTFAFNLKGYHHALLSAILENEYGIETRAGTICNHRLVRRWFHVDDVAQKEIEKKIAGGDRLASYGIVRASLAIHNTKEDIDALVSALKFIAVNGHKLKYKPVPVEEIYVCEE